MKSAAAFLSIRIFTLAVATFLLPCELISQTSKPNQGSPTGTTPTAAEIKAKILTECHYPKDISDEKRLKKALDCVQSRVATLKRDIVVGRSLDATINRMYGVSTPSGPVLPGAQAPSQAPGEGAGQPRSQAPSPVPQGQPSYVGQSASNTPSTCGLGMGSNNPLIRVHRMLMAPKNASDDFGRRLGRRYLIYQVTISNDNKDFQFLIHDVTVDLSLLFGFSPGNYLYSASSQELTLLRGIPEKGQDLDPRNLTLHVLQGIGSVAGGVSGLTPFSDVMGSSVAVFNGAFLQGFVGIASDHTSTQLNRLSDSAYIVNTLIEKQRAKTIAIFIPEATILTKIQQNEYWKDPNSFLQVFNLDQADVCVDGAFITTLGPLTLTSAVLTAKANGQQIGPSADVSLTVVGSNITAGDTQVVGLGPTVTLTNANGTSGTIDDIKLPSDYKVGVPIHLASAANPTLMSATIPTTVAAPTLTRAVLTPSTKGTPLAPGVAATLELEGTNLTQGDTQAVLGTGSPLTLTKASGTTGSVTLNLPTNYVAGMTAQVVSLANSNLKSAAIATTSGP